MKESVSEHVFCYLALMVLCALALWMLSGRHVILVNANVLTMNPSSSAAQSVAWRNGVIEAVGSNQEVLLHRRWYSRVADMQGKTLVPGFIDAHSHFPSSGTREVTIDFSSPPLGTLTNLPGLYQRVEEATDGLAKGKWLIGFNYDQASLQEGQHPSRSRLDEISTDHPIYVYHSSGHMGVANSAALKALSPDLNAMPEHNGLLQEDDAPTLARLLSKLDWFANIQIFFSARDEYARAGVTTVMNGATSDALFKLLWGLSQTPLMPLRTLVSPLAKKSVAGAVADSSSPSIPYFDSLKAQYGSPKFLLGPAKFTADGSPQGYTAFLSKPYTQPGTEGPFWRGEPLWLEAQLESVVRQYHEAGWQLALHGNGDAAISSILGVLQRLELSPGSDRRPVLVHAQTATQEQIAQMKVLGVSPTFFVSHVYYWGDWHLRKTLGPARAVNLSPTGWALQEGLRFSLHSDAPVTPIHPLGILQHAVERLTSSGRLLGPAQRISRDQALRALTIDAAWQYFQEQSLGSIEVGKLADFAVLSEDPLTAKDLRRVSVVQTYVGGRRVF